MLAAVRQLWEEGTAFDLAYSRKPFFLRGEQRNIDKWFRELGLPASATRGDVAEAMGWKPRDSGGQLGKLFKGAGLREFWGSQYADTMDSHRLAYWAATVDPVKGERVWKALSERYFEGKHTEIRPIKLDNRELLLECAAEADLDVENARAVLASDAYRAEVTSTFEAMQQAGINSIPVLIFEVEGLDVRKVDGATSAAHSEAADGRIVHHGSGSIGEFRALLQKLDAACASAAA